MKTKTMTMMLKTMTIYDDVAMKVEVEAHSAYEAHMVAQQCHEPRHHKVHHCEKRGGKASTPHFDRWSMAQGRSPICINDHWLRGVPPLVCGSVRS